MSTVDDNNVTYVHTVGASGVYCALIEYTPRVIKYVLSIEGTKITVQYIYHKVDIGLLLLCYSATIVIVTNCDCCIRVYSLVQNNNLDDCPIRLN